MSSCLAFLLATTLAAATATATDAYGGGQGLSCVFPVLEAVIGNVTRDAEHLKTALDNCCNELGVKGRCLCPPVRELAGMGLPLQSICGDKYSACEGYQSSSGPYGAAGEACSVPDGTTVNACTMALQLGKGFCGRMA